RLQGERAGHLKLRVAHAVLHVPRHGSVDLAGLVDGVLAAAGPTETVVAVLMQPGPALSEGARIGRVYSILTRLAAFFCQKTSCREMDRPGAWSRGRSAHSE